MRNYFWLSFCVLQDGHWFRLWHSMTHNCGPEHTSQIVAVHLCVCALGHSEKKKTTEVSKQYDIHINVPKGLNCFPG